MKLRLTLDEFILSAIKELKREHPITLAEESPFAVKFLKDHGPYNGGVGDAFELPDFVEIELSGPLSPKHDSTEKE